MGLTSYALGMERRVPERSNLSVTLKLLGPLPSLVGAPPAKSGGHVLKLAVALDGP